jgi:hypothetical protein
LTTGASYSQGLAGDEFRSFPPRNHEPALTSKSSKPRTARAGRTTTGLAQPDAERRVDEVAGRAKENIARARRSAVVLAFTAGAAALLGAAASWFAGVLADAYGTAKLPLTRCWIGEGQQDALEQVRSVDPAQEFLPRSAQTWREVVEASPFDCEVPQLAARPRACEEDNPSSSKPRPSSAIGTLLLHWRSLSAMRDSAFLLFFLRMVSPEKTFCR